MSRETSVHPLSFLAGDSWVMVLYISGGNAIIYSSAEGIYTQWDKDSRAFPSFGDWTFIPLAFKEINTCVFIFFFIEV